MDNSKDFDEHRKEQVLRWATLTTPAERLQFVEDALEFAHKSGNDYLKAKHQLASQRNSENKGRV
jgi:hypothetical protein